MTCSICYKYINVAEEFNYKNDILTCLNCTEKLRKISVGIVGSRTLNSKKHFKYMKKYIDGLIVIEKFINVYEIKQIISGGCPEGGDRFAKKYAKYLDIPIFNYFADWNKYGKSAGAIRNKDIVKNSDKFIVFWDSQSKGTKITIDMIIKSEKELHLKLLPKEEELLEFI
jgi:hypothetical protein